LESERDKLNLKVQQGEVQLAKLRQRISDLESEVTDLSRKAQDALA
jgi:predicted  nucleic acid-binding Zn-ribbon protein